MWVQVSGGLYESIIRGGEISAIRLLRSTRIFEHGTGGNEITEFPFFTFLYADLHAHMIAIPFAVLALGLAIGAFLRAGMEQLSKFETLMSLVILGVAVGSLGLINLVGLSDAVDFGCWLHLCRRVSIRASGQVDWDLVMH